MLRSFKEIEQYVIQSDIKKTIVLSGAHDSYALEAVIDAKRKGLVNAVLIGKKKEIEEILTSLNEDKSDYEIIDCQDDKECTKIAVKLIKEDKADIPMKGLLQTSDYLKPILNKQDGLLEAGNVLSQATVVEYSKEDRFFLITDCAINIDPDLERKKQLIINSAKLANQLGIEQVKVAAISALEIVNPKMSSTVDADLLRQANENGEMPGCIVYGPLAFDNAISKEAAMHKHIDSVVAGNADVILVPEICVGNALTKSLIFFTDLKMAGAVLGTTAPIIMTSRTDTPENKYNAILIALLQALKN